MDRQHVTELLQGYLPADPDEARYREQMLALLTSAAPFSREHYTPGHFTTSAFVLSPDRQQLLLILHRKLGLWLQPGGHLEVEDLDLVGACRREVREEVGLDALTLTTAQPFDIDVHEIPPWKTAAAHRHFDVRFLFVAEDSRITQSEEVAGARWVSLTDVAAVTNDRSVLRAASKLVT